MTRIPNLTRYLAVTFDIYGTIIDWEPGIAEFLQTWTGSQGVSKSDTELLSMFDRLRQPVQDERPALLFPEVLRRTLDSMANELNCEATDELKEQFSQIAGTLLPFPDSRKALVSLRQQGLKLGALSNIDETNFARTLKTLDVPFDIIVTAELVRAYKPDKAHFIAALADLRAIGIPRDKVLHVAQSKRADIIPAQELGLSCVWVNRQGHVLGRPEEGGKSARPDFEVLNLRVLLDE